MSTENNDQGKQGDNNKVAKAFDQNIQKVYALLGPKASLKLPKRLSFQATEKVENEDVNVVDNLVSEVFAEENVDLRIKVKEGIKNLLKQYATFESEIKEAEKKLEATKVEKKKAFNAECNKLFGSLDGIETRMKSYAAALRSTNPAAAAEAENASTQQEEEVQSPE